MPGAEDRPYQIGAMALCDQVRVFVASVSFKILAVPLQALCTWFAPEELRFYVSEVPVFDLGDSVDMGVAAHFSPQHHRRREDLGGKGGGKGEGAMRRRAGGRKEKDEADSRVPGFFVCNVGYVDATHEAGLSDLQRTMNATRDIWNEFRSEAPGLISNVVCLFPSLSGTRLAREVNLSAWTSEEAAGEWYSR